MNKKIAVSAGSILASLTLLGGIAFAVFSDQATATANTFSSGNADLTIAPDTGSGPGTFASSISGASFSDIAPGFSDRFLFWLKNESTSDVDLDLTADVSSVAPPSSDLGGALLISWTCDTDGNGGLADNTPSSEFSPQDWEAGGNASIGTLTPGEQMICAMNARVPGTATDDISGETVSFDALYDATQTP